LQRKEEMIIFGLSIASSVLYNYERKKRVINLYFNQHKSYAEIAEIEQMSPRDIHAIVKEEKARRQKYKLERQQQEISSKAYKLFSEGKRPVQVAITLNLGQPEVTKLYREYWRLRALHKLNLIYKETNGKLGLFLKLYRLMKEKGMSIEQVVNAVNIAANKLPYMESLYEQVKEQVDNMQRTRQGLVNDIEARKNTISLLDKIGFSCEQERKRTEQRVQELIDKKNRIENLIANIVNNDEGYSKLKQLVKENVKAALSENKQVISIAFTALLQTLKSDPEQVKLIYNMTTANTGYEDNSNNIAKFIEANKDRLLDLTEKQYENLVEALTNNAIDIMASPSNPPLSLPQSSSTFPNLFTQRDTYRIKEPEIYDNRNGDIAE
jgi:predicted HTH domain antitoxin